jgi:uncharacterized cysteine cluster protein YcgN (CxxCxxCC family)
MRNCDGCVACCNGTLSAMIGDHEVYRGSPCPHISCEKLNCSIYNDRPEVCKQFRCLWLIQDDIPEWMKPSNSGILLIYRPTPDPTADKGLLHAHVVEGSKATAAIVMSVVYYAYRNDWTLKFIFDGRQPEFSYVNGIINFNHGYMELSHLTMEKMQEVHLKELEQHGKMYMKWSDSN